MRYQYILLLLLMFSFTSAVGDIGTVKQHDCIDLYNYCPTCSYINLVAIKYPNVTTITMNEPMTKTGNNYQYEFCGTEQLGEYFYTTCGDKGGFEEACEDIAFQSTGGSLMWIILITSLGVVFLIASLFVDEEFFVYISGILFLLGGVYLMINGIGILNDDNTRNLSYIYIGVGLLFTVGAYIYNSYSKYREEEEY